MRFVLLALIFLAACNQAPSGSRDTAPTAPEVPEAAALTQGRPMATGLMSGFSDPTAGAVSLIEVRADALQFFDGEGAPTVAAQTVYLGEVSPDTRAGENGQSFAAIASAPTDVRVELRRVVAPAPTALCWGDEPASYVALVYGEPLTVLSLVAFYGADAPGPDARDSMLCATYAYAVD